jgi:hypothetical protein
MKSINKIEPVNHLEKPTFERQRCEVWTRVMGYYRPVSQFNAGKKSEHKERLHFSEDPVFRLRAEDVLPFCDQAAV